VDFNLFDYFESLAGPEQPAPWAARAPRRPRGGSDVYLFPRSQKWETDTVALDALKQVEAQPWVHSVEPGANAVGVQLADSWIDAAGAALEAGGTDEQQLTDLASEKRYSVQFWDANATKALHIGHLRNLAIGNALAAALEQAGARVERRSRISDMGRAMGEAMAGIVHSGRHTQGWSDGDGKSDHFVGACYADYVAAGGGRTTDSMEGAEDSLSREVDVQNDTADELIQDVLIGEPEAIELWYRTRAWVIAGQRKTLARLGVSFDKVFFESDFLSETRELTKAGLESNVLRRREDGVIVYMTGLEELDEVPLVRADGLSTQHLRSLTYALTAPELDGMTSLQVTGSEWVSHLASIRKLVSELQPGLNGGFHPSHSIFHGMVSQRSRALTSSAGALLIDELMDRIDSQIDTDAASSAVRAGHPSPERVAAQVALGFFLPYPISPDVDFDPDRLLLADASLGWDLARARARTSEPGRGDGRPTAEPDYRFAVVQSELYRRHLRLALQRLDVTSLANYARHLAIWYLEDERSEAVERVVHTLLDRSARGLGLETAR
jgi:arginyl-tRNA synthetase